MKANQRYSDEQVKEALKKSFTYKQVCENLGAKTSSGSRAWISRRIKNMGLDTSHMLGRAAMKGRVSPTVKPVEDYLSNKLPIQSAKLKRRLYKEGLKERKCEECGLTSWQGEEIVMDIDHIDGNRKNNNLSNLKIMCPNCHRLKTSKNNWERK